MELRSGKTIGMSTVEAKPEDRIAYWRTVAESLGVEAANLPEFVADRIQKENLDQGKLKIIQAETDERIQYVKEQRERDAKEAAERALFMSLEKSATEEKLNYERKSTQEKLKYNKAEHELRMEALEIEKSRTTGNTQFGMADSFKPTLPIFDESREDIAMWLKRFERVATLYKWHPDTWATRVSTHVTGQAAEVYNALDDSSVADYKVLKTALLARYQLTAETYRRRFRNCERRDTETFAMFASRVDDTLGKWLELSGINDVRQLVALEQFLSSLNADMAAYVRERKPKTLKEAADAAEVYFEAHNGFGEGTRVRGRGGLSRSEPRPEPVQGSPSELDGRACYVCASPLHLAQSCPQRKGKGWKTGETTSSSMMVAGGSQSQTLVSIPALSGPFQDYYSDFSCVVLVAGVAVQGMRDTGAEVCVVKKSLVLDSQFTGQQFEVSMADRAVRKQFPVARVAIESPYFTGEVEAVVMEMPVADFIVGNHAKLGDSTPLPVCALTREISDGPQTLIAGEEKTCGSAIPSSEVSFGGVVQLRRLQMGDHTLRSIRKAADSGVVRISGKRGRVTFLWIEGILYRRHLLGRVQTTQVVVPTGLREEVMSLAHRPLIGSHHGVRRTRSEVWELYFWPGMRADIRRFVVSCGCRRQASGGRREGRVGGKSLTVAQTACRG